MTTIEKLQIQGIRSFAPSNSRNVIEFYKPLTIIVGHNGAGKTTIIECLKYACTGEFPPNATNGQAFVHDTKIAGETEVKANVKLQFRTISNHPFICIRQISLTQNANRQTLKSLNTSLRTTDPRTGEKRSQTMKCSDMDKEIPELMGVSKAVLESVIFCHQEESNWPLSDNAKLKAKFDDIFSATRYTKAVEAVRKQQKAQNGELGKLRLELENFALLNSEITSINQKIDEKKQRYADLKDTEDVLKSQIGELDGHLGMLTETLQSKSEIQSVIVNLQKTIQSKEDECKRFYDTLTEKYEESKEDLELQLADYISLIEDSRQKLEENKGDLQKLKQREAAADRSLQSTFGTLARIEAKVNKYQEQQESMDRKAVVLITEYFPNEDSNAFLKAKGVHNVIALLEKMLSQYDHEYSQLRSANESEAVSLRKEQSEYLQKETELSTKIKHFQTDLNAKQLAAQGLKKGSSNEARIEEAISQLTENLQIENAKLETLREGWDDMEMGEKKDSVSRKMDELVLQRDALERDFIRISSQAQKRASLEHTHKRFREKSEELERLRAENRDIFQSTFHIDITTADNASEAIASRVKEIESQESELQKKQTQIKQKDSEYAGQIKSHKQLIESCQSSLDSAIRLVQAVCEDYQSYPSALEQSKSDMEDLRNELSIKQSAESLYLQFLDFAKRKSKCMVCERAFPSSEETRKFESKLKSFIDDLPADASTAKKAFENAEAKYKSLQKLSGTWEKIQEIETQTKPQHLEKYNSLKETLLLIREKDEKAKSQLASLKQQLDTLRPLLEVALSISRLNADVAKLSADVRMEEEQLKSYDSDTRTSEDVLSLKEQVQSEIDSLIRRKSDYQEQCIQQERAITEASGACAALDAKLRVAKEELKRVQTQKARLDESLTEIAHLEERVRSMSEEVEGVRGKMAASKNKIFAHTSKCKETEAEAMKKKYDLEKKLGPLKSTHAEVKAINLSEESTDMEKLRGEQAAYRKDLESIRKQITEMQNVVFLGDQEVMNSGAMVRNIENNIKYRELMEKTEKEKKNLADFLRENSNISEEVARLTAEKKAMEEKRDSVKTKWDKCKGVRIQLREDIVTLQQERGQSKFSDVEKNHRKKVIEVQVTELSVKDLEVYYKALDRALVKYHSAKMSEINTTVKELWQATYKGEDIDYIEIRSELPPNSTHTKRAYDYRVVMVKGDIDIDMRGRCSAGQKVLASLVIRLALAETFCVNCGILALDEPTTNLDRRNVESFANALVEIVENRRRQKHFQLIVITHDEEFVQLLGKSNNADFYWRVSKVSGGSSILKRHEISDLS